MVHYPEKREVMNWEIWAALLPVIAGIVGVWVNLNSTVARLKSRVMQLEITQDEFKQIAKELLISIHKIKSCWPKWRKSNGVVDTHNRWREHRIQGAPLRPR